MYIGIAHGGVLPQILLYPHSSCFARGTAIGRSHALDETSVLNGEGPHLDGGGCWRGVNLHVSVTIERCTWWEAPCTRSCVHLVQGLWRDVASVDMMQPWKEMTRLPTLPLPVVLTCI